MIDLRRRCHFLAIAFLVLLAVGGVLPQATTAIATATLPSLGTGEAAASAYRGDVRLDPSTHGLRATITVDFCPLTSTRRFECYFNPALSLASVSLDGAAVKTSQNGWRLRIDLPRQYAAGDTVSLSFAYSGSVVSTGWGATRAHIGDEGSFLASEAWLPLDLAWSRSVPATLTVDLPAGQSLVNLSPATAASGADPGRTKLRLVTTDLNLVAGAYEEQVIVAEGIRIRLCTYTAYPAHAATLAAEIPAAVSFVRRTLGEAPLTELTIAHMPAVAGFGSGVAYPGLIGLVADYRYARGYDVFSVLPHELTHRWQQTRGGGLTGSGGLWLSEATATYVGMMYLGERFGPARFADAISQAGEVIRRDRLLDGGGSILAREAGDRPDLRYSTVYLKGALALDALRHELGEPLFREYLLTHLDWDVAELSAWIARCSALAGRDLKAFFADWLEGDSVPAQPAGLSATGGTLNVSLTPTTGELSGEATLALVNRLGDRPGLRLTLDSGLTVTAVTVRGTAAAFIQSARDLAIMPQGGLAAGEAFPVTISYQGTPTAVAAADPAGSTLAAERLWYPSLDDLAWPGEVVLRLPAGWSIRADGWSVQGRSTGETRLLRASAGALPLSIAFIRQDRQPLTVAIAAVVGLAALVALVCLWRRHQHPIDGND